MHVRRVDPSALDPALREVRRIAGAALEADGRDPLNEAARLSLQNRGLEGGALWLAGPADEAAGFAYLHGLSGPGRPEVDLVVAPAARGRGAGLALAEAALDLTGDRPLTAWSHGNHPAAAALGAEVGFAAVRELWLMRRRSAPVDAPVEEAATLDEVPPPEGCTIRPFRPGRDDDAFLEVNAAAFAHHPEQGSLDRSGLAERMAEDWFDPAGFLVAERHDEIVGFHWTKVSEGRGEVYVIGVRPGEQGSGLGRALLVAGLRHLADLPETVLYVEADNTGAIRLYESYGFTHAPVDTDVMYAGPGPARRT